LQRSGQAYQVLWSHTNYASPGAVDVGYEKERDRHEKRQYHRHKDPLLTRSIAD